ncbi:proton-coupled folate transporter [Drosophila rhopaloa]|uniref:Proton-coupled folate transporter n=1 Tax=Drosophila rhopaloa TaxID=1041015 RepID=A0A6P4EUC1_DRORH|nr:proton-coupled folate transporter [Drosophila rhopaloa]XP_016981738.1 proton-coupled folate transporter [Drosophila rhopaloa]
MVEKTSLAQLKSLEWGRLFNMFYIEPVIFMLIFSHMLSGTVMRNQLIYQTCTVIFEYNETDCKLLDSKNTTADIQAIETQLQSYVANMFLTRTLFESIVPAICGLFIGSWSDHYGRKPLLIVSMVGFSASALLSSAICWLSSYYMVNPWWYTLAALPHSLLGGLCVFSVAAFCFITDTTDMKTRPYRMIFMELILFVALTSGSLLSSFVYAATSAAFVQSLSCLIVISATLFVIFYLPESLGMCPDLEETAEKEKEIVITVSDQKVVDVSTDSLEKRVDPPKYETIDKPPIEDKNDKAGLFSVKHVKDMFTTCFKRRENNAHTIIWLVTLAGFVSIFVADGVMTVMYLFVRQQFHLTVREFTIFETVSQSVPMLGALLGILILRKLFGLSVVSLALLSLISEILSNIARGFASLTWHLYLSVALGVFRSIQGPMCRTIVSNIVPSSDTGKLFAIGNIVQSFAPFVAAPLYTAIYKSSLASNPGGFNFLSAAFYLIAFILIGCVMRIKFKHRKFYAKTLK